MRTKMKRLAVAVFFGLFLGLALSVAGWGGPAAAADAEGKYVINGAGTLGCLVWLEERLNISWKALSYTAWVQGYISAHNEYTDGVRNVIDGADVATLNAWIDNHCKKNPDGDLHRAAEAAIKHFGSQK